MKRGCPDPQRPRAIRRVLRCRAWASTLVAASLVLAAPQAGANVIRLTSAPSAVDPDVAVDESGAAHVAWAERPAPGHPGVLVYCRVPRGAQGCAEVRSLALPGAQTGDGQRVLVSPAGEVVLVARRFGYGGVAGIYVMTSGASFTPRKLSDLAWESDWDAQFGPGDFSVSLAHATCSPGVRYQAASLGAMTESAAALTPFGGCSTSPSLGSPAIAFDGRLSPLVAFRVSAAQDAHGDSEIYFRRWNGPAGYHDAASWSPPRLVARGDGTRLASGARGAYAMYHDPRVRGTTQTNNYWVRRYNPAANAFGSAARVSRGAQVGGDFTQDAGGNLHVVVVAGEQVLHRVSRDGVSWDPARVLATRPFSGPLRVAASRDGGGAAVAAAQGIYLLPFGRVGGGGDPPCPPSVTVGVVVVRALEGCLRRDGSRYTTGAAVKVNGVDVEPRDDYSLTVDAEQRTLETRGQANVRVGDVVLDRREIAWKLPQGEGKLQRLGVPDVSVFPDLARFAKTMFSFPVKGDAELRVTTGATALIDTSFQLPGLLGGVTGDVTLRTTDQQGLVLDGFRIKVPQARIGKLRIAAIDVVYESDPDVFKGSAQIQLPPAYDSPIEVAFGFREGRLNLLHLEKEFARPLPIVGAPPEPVVGLDLLGFDYLDEAGSRTFQGLVELQGGPKVRGLFRVSELDGKVTLTFPPEPRPASIEASGELKVVGIPFATGHVKYTTDNVFSFDGTFQFPPPGKWAELARFGASVAGFLALSKPYPFSAAGDATATIAGVPVRGEAVVSTKGISACVGLPFPIPDLGISYRWGDDYPTPFCNIGEFKLQAPGIARAAQDLRTISIPDGLPQAALAITGRAGAPTVTVTAPSGEQVTSGSNAGRFITQRLDEAATTYVTIGHPPAGRYTIEPIPGSPPIDHDQPGPRPAGPERHGARQRQARHAHAELPDPHDRGPARHLRRAIGGGPLPGAGEHPAPARSDHLPAREIKPSAGARSSHSSSRTAYPRAKLELARFSAPKPRPLTRPRYVQVRRKGTRLWIGWSKVKGARGYELRIDLPRDGRRLLRNTTARRRSLAIRGLERNDTGTVTVRAIDVAADRGEPRTARVRAKRR